MNFNRILITTFPVQLSMTAVIIKYTVWTTIRILEMSSAVTDIIFNKFTVAAENAE